MTRSQVRKLVEESSLERIREVLNRLQALKRHEPIPDHERAFLHDLRDHEEFFRSLADARLQQGK
jgi:hypothetical protein